MTEFPPVSPGIRRINPDAEAARLARKRLDPPDREWGIRHPGGKVTVQSCGQVPGIAHPVASIGS